MRLGVRSGALYPLRMNLLGLALLLIVVGVVLWAAAIAAHLGWVLLIVGIVLLVVSFVVDGAGGVRWPRR